MTAAIGNLEGTIDDRLLGWCWLPSRPAERAVVEILINGEAASTLVASRFDPVLRQLAIGDGAHGFDVPRPPAPRGDEPYLVEAREQSTGSVVGRLCPGKRPNVGTVNQRLDSLEQAIEELRRSLENDATEASLLHRALRTLASVMNKTPASKVEVVSEIKRSIDVCLQDILKGNAGFSLPWSDDPKMTIVLLHKDFVSTMANVRPLSCWRADPTVEAVVVEAGDDPLAALLPASFRNLRLFRAELGQLASALNAAVLATRGSYLIFAETLVRDDFALLADLARANLVCSGTQEEAAGLEACGDAQPPTLQARSRILLAAPRAAFMAAGGFDPSDGYRAAASNAAFKMGLLGLPVMDIERHPLLS